MRKNVFEFEMSCGQGKELRSLGGSIQMVSQKECFGDEAASVLYEASKVM